MLYLRLIIFLVGGDVSVDNETLLVTDFVNLKINLAQSFRNAHKDKMCVRVFIGISTHMFISIYVCTVFFNKKMREARRYSLKQLEFSNTTLTNRVIFLRQKL
jgi:hypothetical protein